MFSVSFHQMDVMSGMLSRNVVYCVQILMMKMVAMYTNLPEMLMDMYTNLPETLTEKYMNLQETLTLHLIFILFRTFHPPIIFR